MAKDLSPAKCVLLTIHYASEGNIEALHSFTPTRLDALNPELILRILLTYLPESIEPREYTTYVGEVASRLYLDVEREDVEVELSPVQDISEDRASSKVRKLKLLDATPPAFPPHAPEDLLTRFLCHRAYRIDAETGLLNLVPQLIEPFLDRRDYLRTWYISVVLPVLRLEFEYYPEDESLSIGLRDFERLSGKDGIQFLMQKSSNAGNSTGGSQQVEVARDIKGLVGPWTYGHTERKRRKIEYGREPNPQEAAKDSRKVDSLRNGTGKISLDGVTEEDKTGHDWEYMYLWLVFQAQANFPTATQAVENWDGPGDVDLGGFNTGNSDTYLDEDTQSKLEAQYAQAAFASCYAAQANTQQTIHNAHAILARLAELLDFIPPPDLATSVDSLPRIERHATLLDQSQTIADLEPDVLLSPRHPLTTPRIETYMLLQMFVYSAYQFSGLGHPISLINTAKLHFHASAQDQLSVLQKILRGLSQSATRRDDVQWIADRARLMWLWNWNINGTEDHSSNGAGVLGKIERKALEEEMLKCFLETGCYDLVINLYFKAPENQLERRVVQQVVLMKAMEAYDGASNGNKTRGGMKKANDIISTFRSYFPQSTRFRQASALIAATHSLSFYSLTLQHGVPFQPVSIRVSHDPIGLISKVLDQNSRSYTKLDDLIDIGRNFVSAGLPQAETNSARSQEELENDDLALKRKDAERRVTFMAVEAALREDDFETAYSYIVNRLTPSSADIEASRDSDKSKHHTRYTSKGSTHSKAAASDDDMSWRAAFLAGRYRPAASSPPTLRRLEQRTELLSLALLLAPVSALTEILAAWRRCEEEMTSLQVSQQQAEQEFDDRADKRQSTSSLPGNFTVQDEQPEMVLNQKRREMGRMSGKPGEGEAPVSMFDLTRSAAQAFSKNAFPLRGAARTSSDHESGSMDASRESVGSENGMEGGQRVRKRDVVANAVSGGLASGLGWVLGATPGKQQQEGGQE